MRPKVVFPALFVCLTAIAGAQTSATLTFPSDGERESWVSTGLPSAPAKDSVRSTRDTLELDLGNRPDTDAAFVWDKATGNLASRSLGDIRREKGWKLDSKSFIDVAEVVVKVEYRGKPVAAAEVVLNDSRRDHRQILDPAAAGTARFFAVKPGSLKVTVNYRSGNSMAPALTQVFSAPLNRSETVPSLTISLPNEVLTTDTVGVKPRPQQDLGGATPANGSESPPEGTHAMKPGTPVGSTNPLGSAVLYLLGIGAVGAAGYFGFQYLKKNADRVGPQLEKLGVQIPKPGDEEPDPGSAPIPMPVQPAPQQKIILDDGASDLNSPVAPSTGWIEPRLVSTTGDAFTIPEGTTVVGREAGLGLSLVGETTVSRNHAHLVRTAGEVRVTDLGSTNGTFVNNAPLQGETVLRPGDWVQFGAVRFRYEG